MAETKVRFHHEPAVGERFRQRKRPLAGRECSWQIAGDPGVIADVGRDAREPESVLERLGEAFRLAQVLGEIGQATHRIQGLHQIDPEVQLSLLRVAARREVPDRIQPLLEAGDRLAMRRAVHRLTAGPVEMRHRFVPHLAVAVVHAERQRVPGQLLPVHLFQALGHPSMQRLPERGRQLLDGNFPDPVVAELEPLLRTAQHAEANQLFHALRGVALRQGSGPLDERKVESAPDHRRNVDEAAPPFGEAIQPPADKGPDSGGERQPRGAADRSSLVKRMHHLDHDERIAITPAPCLLGQLLEQRLGDPRGREQTHEGGSVGAGERRHRHPLQLSISVELVQRPAEERAVRELLLPDGGERQERDRAQAPAEEREQADAHLIGPVEIFQRDDQWLPLREAPE